jgi:hypothetical protein
LVDTKYLCFWPNPDNGRIFFFAANRFLGIPVKAFEGSGRADEELGHLVDLLDDLRAKDDVRKVLREKFLVGRTLQEVNLL